MSYDLVLWKRSTRTKTAMLKECFDRIMDGNDHIGMDFFNSKSFYSDMESEFGKRESQYFGADVYNCPFLYDTGEGEYGNWIVFNLSWKDHQETSNKIIEFAVKNEIMVYDPQIEGVYGNKKPKT